ncbi:Histidine--tRNA ligase [Geodia barretti]|uniref:histidine--tRNA ligase n=1 Tax=Geodia barretti TaxID=519541 RepID=A0AA35RWC0_GEOBA|nr:Histidine--tRNA ligase [Geodia barretti]
MISAVSTDRPNPVRRLPGMRDFDAGACRRKHEVERQLAEFIGRFGYSMLEVPVLETTELFLRKSGGDLASQMYSFIDPGSNAVSLRPEFTSAIMRHYLEMTRDSGESSLVRWQYCGPVFRYDTGSAADTGEFTQVGAELVGSNSILADAELLTMAAGVPDRLGIPDYRIRLADLDVLDSALDTVGLSDRAREFIVANMNRIGEDSDSLAATLQRAAELHVIAGIGLPDEEQHLAVAVSGLPDGAARSVLSGFMRWNTSADMPLGRRSPDEIVDRLLRKLRGGDASGAVERGLALAGQLASVKGDPVHALPRARSIVAAAGADTRAIDRLIDLTALIGEDPAVSRRLEIDFSLARGIAYYNGIIFDIVRGDAGTSLGGGGRYDALARALGGTAPVPALGFAFTLETLLSAMPPADQPYFDPDVAVVSPDDAGSVAKALRAVADIRRQGGVAVLEIRGDKHHTGLSGTVTE